MKTVVFITGTNAVGKSTLAKVLQARFGGIAAADKWLTVCKDSRVCFAGKYGDGKFGGVDGFNQTKCLEGVVRFGLTSHDVIICEGMYLHTFGINLTNALFLGDNQLVVFLYAPVTEINRRLLDRAGKGITNEAVWKKQQATAASARKWASIGVPVLSFDTSKTTPERIADLIIKHIPGICTE